MKGLLLGSLALFGAAGGAQAVDWNGGDGEWSDSAMWSSGAVPEADDSVSIASGVVSVTADVEIDSLTLSGGTLSLQGSSCDQEAGWIPINGKCFRGFGAEKNWDEAQAYCALFSVVSNEETYSGHLAAPETTDEARAVDRACRGVGDEDCWIGLHSSSTEAQDWQWPDDALISTSPLRLWAERAPTTWSTSEEGELCVWQYNSLADSESQRKPRWRNDNCGTPRPFVCSILGVTERIQVSVANDVTLSGTTLSGAGDVVVGDQLTMSGDDVTLTNSAGLTLLDGATGSLSAGELILARHSRVQLEDGARVDVTSSAQGIISGGGATSWVQVADGATLDIAVDGYRVETWLGVAGTIDVDTSMTAILSGGGYASGTAIIRTDAALELGNGSFSMTSPKEHTITLTADREVVDEVDGNGYAHGYLRFDYKGERSRCVPYHATADELSLALNALSNVEEAGGVSVRREGDGSEEWSFGYAHEVLFDRVSDYGDASSLSVWGYGPEANCSTVYSPLPTEVVEDSTINYHCLPGEVSDPSDPTRCTITPVYTFAELESSGAVSIAGAGSVIARNGTHVGPVVAPSVVVIGGELAFRADELAIDELTIYGGDVWVTGAAVEGWEARDLLYAGEETVGRMAESLLDPPAVAFTADIITISSGNLRVTSGTGSISTGEFDWRGGSLWGGCLLTAATSLSISGSTDRQLRDGFQVGVAAAAEGVWSGGTIKAGEGAGLAVHGALTITSDGDLLWLRGEDARPQLSNQNGWYNNPVCRDVCEEQPWLLVSTDGVLTKLGEWGSRTTVEARLLSYGGTVVVGSDGNTDPNLAGVEVTLELLGGGHCTGVFTVEGGALAIVGGQSMDLSQIAISGSGTLEFRGPGPHRGSPTVAAEMVMRDGTTVAFNHSAVTFSNTLWQEGGDLVFEAQTAVEMESHVRVDSGSWTMPILHTASAVWHPARSTIEMGDSFTWNGGTFLGNCDTHARHYTAFAGGEKELRHKWLLKTYARLDWHSGDLHTFQLAELRVEGTVQMFEDAGKVTQHGQFEECCPYDDKELLQWE